MTQNAQERSEFIALTDLLTGKNVRLLRRLAVALNVGESHLYMARVTSGNSGKRPPNGWKKAVLEVAEEYHKEYGAFVEGLRTEVNSAKSMYVDTVRYSGREWWAEKGRKERGGSC